MTCVINHAFFHLVTGVIDYAFLLGDAGRFYRALFSSRLTALACDPTRVNSFYSADFLLFLFVWFGLFVVVFNIYLNSVLTSLSDGCN